MWDTLKSMVWRFTLRQIRVLVWAIDEWIHAQELKLREPAAAGPIAPPVEFDRKASAAREKVFRKTAARATRPRLRYQAGQFVRVSQ